MPLETSLNNHTDTDICEAKQPESDGPKLVFESPAWSKSRFVLEILGFIVHVVNIGTGIAYFTSAQFYSQDTYYPVSYTHLTLPTNREV